MCSRVLSHRSAPPAGSFTRTGIETLLFFVRKRHGLTPAGSFTRTGIETRSGSSRVRREMARLRPSWLIHQNRN